MPYTSSAIDQLLENFIQRNLASCSTQITHHDMEVALIETLKDMENDILKRMLDHTNYVDTKE